MNRPRILDLYCGAGAVSRGLVDAGFDVVGVDIEPQPRYPYAFVQHDALTIDPRFARSFDAIWASPPCLRDTVMRHAPGAKGDQHPALIAPTLAMLERLDVPFVVENVPGARRHFTNPVTLCGSMFGLGAAGHQLQRHRLFQASFPLAPPCACQHTAPVIGIYGGHVRNRGAKSGGRGTRDFVDQDKKALAMEAMGIDWPQTMDEISQAVPPAYSRYIGGVLLANLQSLTSTRSEAA